MTEKTLDGWQKQPNKLNIQGEIERAIELITRRKSRFNRFTVELIVEFVHSHKLQILKQIAKYR